MPNHEVRTRKVEANGASFYVEESGAGTPVLLVHGGSASSAMYHDAAKLMASEFHVVTFDDRGHGRSTNPSGELSYALTADDAAALVGALGLEPPFVGGMSDGGQVALEFGLRHPGRSRGLLVGAAYPDFQTDFAREMVRGVFHGDTDGVIDFEAVERESPLLVEFWRTNHNQDDDQWLRVAQQTLTMCLEYPGLTQRQVESISDPALVIQGDTDELVPLAAAMDLFSWLPNAEFAVLPGTDHFRPVVDPTLMVAVMRDYMRRHQ